MPLARLPKEREKHPEREDSWSQMRLLEGHDMGEHVCRVTQSGPGADEEKGFRGGDSTHQGRRGDGVMFWGLSVRMQCQADKESSKTLQVHSIMFPSGTATVYQGICTVRKLSWVARGKESTCQSRRHKFDLWVRKTPWRRKRQPTPVFFPGKSLGQRSLAGYGPGGHKESART